MLLFFDGFETANVANFEQKWEAASGNVLFDSNQGRDGSRNARITSAGTLLDKNIIDSQPIIAGCAFQPTTGASGTVPIMEFLNVGSHHIQIRMLLDGSIEVRRSSSVVLGVTAAPVLIFDEYNFIEVRVFVDNSVGAVEVRVGASTVLLISGVDTQTGAVASVNRVRFGGHSGGVGARIDVCYIGNEVGPSPHNTFLGNLQVNTLFPTANGDLAAIPTLFPVGGNAFEKINEALLDGDATYIQSTLAGQISTFEYGNIPAIVGGAEILAVVVGTSAYKVDTGLRILGVIQRVASVNSTLNTFAMTTGESVTHLSLHTVNPITGAAWTDDEVNALQVGMEVR